MTNIFVVFPTGKIFHLHRLPDDIKENLQDVPYTVIDFKCTECKEEVDPLTKLRWFQYTCNTSPLNPS